MVQQRQRIRRLLRHGIVGGPRPAALPASAIIHANQTDAGQVRRHIVEIRHGPGQTGKAENGQPRPLIGIGKAGAVGGLEELGHRVSLALRQAGMGARPGEGGSHIMINEYECETCYRVRNPHCRQRT